MPAAPYAVAPARESNSLAVAALVVGIIGLLGAFCFGFPGLLLGLIAVVLGIMGIRRANELPGAPQKGLAVAGIVIGSISLLIGLAIAALIVFGAAMSDSDINTDPSDGSCDSSRYLQDPDC